MQFIVEQQAQLAADMQQVRKVLSTQSQAIVTVVGLVGKLTETQQALAETQSTHATRIALLETKMTELAEAGQRTEDRSAKATGE